MNKIFSFLIKTYQTVIRSVFQALGLKSECTFYPNCSEYGKIAFEKFGFWKAFYLTTRRICRCHPWQKNHFDPI